MMYPFPFFRPPFPPFRYHKPTYNNSSNSVHNENVFDANLNINQKQKESSETKELPAFEIFGIKLYDDDLLIIGLLFFLYSEGVQDQELFISLMLLLLS